LKRLPLRLVSPIFAAVLFAILSFAATRQTHVVDLEGWGPRSGGEVAWDAEPLDIGTPADILLLAFNLPALIALLPLLPLTYWVDSEIVLRGAWGLGAVGQWFLIGSYFDMRRGLLPAGKPRDWRLLSTMGSGITMVAGGLAFGVGLFRAVAGHDSFWAVTMDASFVFWGIVLVVVALRWRSSSSRARKHFNSLRLS
jgi:hypothetical protein